MTNPSCITRVIRGSLTQAILAWTYSFTSLIDPFHTHSKRISGKQHGVTLSKVGSSSGLNVRQRMGQLLPPSSLGLPQELLMHVHNDVGCSNVLLVGFEGARVKVLPPQQRMEGSEPLCQEKNSVSPHFWPLHTYSMQQVIEASLSCPILFHMSIILNWVDD